MRPLLWSPLLCVFAGLALAQPTMLPVCNGTNEPDCTDYFAFGNWANSPVPSGSITGFTLIAGGTGYINPLVVISDPTGTLAAGTADMLPTLPGVISGITFHTGGSGYIMPTVSIVDVGTGGSLAHPTCGGTGQPVCGSGALAAAVIGGTLTGGMHKFLDPLPDLKAAVAVSDTTTFPGSDYYEIQLNQYTEQLHADLPPTHLRGYAQVPTGSVGCAVKGPNHYLGPLIVARKDVPVRIKFTNCLPTGSGGDLFIPTDTTYPGAGKGPSGADYTENRGELHLHGGVTPWISDGTPHQWTVPVGDTTPLQKGDSVAYVPDMWFEANGKVITDPSCAGHNTCSIAGATNNPGDGSLSYYWTNEQGGRLMFYHDHSYGITRLNVYVGEAAGYLLVDPVAEATLKAATAPGTIVDPANLTSPTNDLQHLIPLAIQDKSFVPSTAQLGAQDPTWCHGGMCVGGQQGNFGATPVSSSGSNGDLWWPHVYMPNQNPSDESGTNAFGRFDYGAWFWPPQTSLTAATPPTAITVACMSDAFSRPLGPSASCPSCGCPITPNPSGTPESFMDTPVVNGRAYPVLHVAPEAYRFSVLSSGNDRSWNLSWFVADPAHPTEVAMLPAVIPNPPSTPLALCSTITPVAVPNLVIGLATALIDTAGNPFNGTGLPSGCWPNYGPIPGVITPHTMWAADGRNGGAPDPRTAGPPWIQIGSEGGVLPAPVVIPATPINYELNVRSITVTSVAVHGLWLGPAERADVIVDFSKFAGKTLILYNDAPTPAPALDARLDYFTGDGDQTPIGGAPNTPVGFGPNTRTLMQVFVDQPTTGQTPFSLSELKKAFVSTPTTPGVFAATQPTIIVPQTAYNSAYNASFPNTLAPIAATNLTFTPIGSAPTFNRPPCPATAPATCGLLDSKAIQELFTLDYGRMNSTLGVEVPFTNFTTQTTIPYGFTDWPTEIIKEGQTQLWKVTHNGVDSHFIHFHLFNVQVVNRVGWDGSLRPVDQNELGWKDTVRMNPLEDIVVALQPITPVVPFPVPDSIRPMNVINVPLPGTIPDPLISGISPENLAVNNGRTNALVNFGWEYVWHCHLLGHEENDMMRPIIFQVAPPAPTDLVASGTAPTVDLSWKDNSASESGFILERDELTSFLPTDPGYRAFTLPPSGVAPGSPPLPPNGSGRPGTSFGETLTFQDTTGTMGVTYYYRIQAIDDFMPQSPLSFGAGAFQTTTLASLFSNIACAGATCTKLTPTVSFAGAPATAAFGTSFTVTASTTSNVLPTITSGNASVCTVGAVSGTPLSSTAVVTMHSGVGACALTASWPETTTFLAATATQHTTAVRATPLVTFTGAPATAPINSTFMVTATTTATGIAAPTITSSATTVCTVGPISGISPATATITMHSNTGTCTLTAIWSANNNFAGESAMQHTLAGVAANFVRSTSCPAPTAAINPVNACPRTGTISVTAGDTLVIWGQSGTITAWNPPTQVTGTTAHLGTISPQGTCSTTGVSQCIWTVPVIGSGTLAMNISASSTASQGLAAIMTEASNATTVNAMSTYHTSSCVGGACTGGSLTTTAASLVLTFMRTCCAVTISSPSPFTTFDVNNSPGAIASGHFNQPALGVYTPTWSISPQTTNFVDVSIALAP